MQTQSQNQFIKNYLNNGNSITAIDALRLCGCFRLSARIKNLRDQGMNILSEMVEVNGKRVARYTKL